jgi:hypothetical protein
MNDVPRWYVPIYLLIKLPLLILAGAGAAFLLILWPGRAASPGDNRRLETALFAFIAVFPVICEVIDRGPAYTGLRHFLFVVPPFAALAGRGFDWLLTRIEAHGRALAKAALATVGAVLLWNAALMIALHPYQYLYFNRLVGGLEGASGRYDTDYWVNTMPEAVDALQDYVAELDRDGDHTRRYSVGVCAERLPFEKQAGPRLQWTADWMTADFFIAPTHMNCDRVVDGTTIATISRLGARIGVVKDRRELAQAEIARRR